MTNAAAFLQAILETPDDDTPRLIYADWLDEHGDPARAEFIRLQCQIEETLLDNPSWPDLLIREENLLAENAIDWLGELWPSLVGWTFRRGFLAEIVLPVATYLEKRLKIPPTVKRVAVDLNDVIVAPEALEILPETMACVYKVLPIALRDGVLTIATADKANAGIIEDLRNLLRLNVDGVEADAIQIRAATDRCYRHDLGPEVDFA